MPNYVLNTEQLAGDGTHEERLKQVEKSINRLLFELQSNLIRIDNRVTSVEKVGQTKPPCPRGLSAEGRQGVLHVIWQKVYNIDGYVLTMSSDPAARQIIARVTIPDPETQLWSFPIGNVVVTRYFQIWAIQNGVLSDGSEIISAASVAYGVGETAPTAPALTSEYPPNLPPKFLTGAP